MVLWDTFFEAGTAQLKKGAYSKAEELFRSAMGEADSFPTDDPRRARTALALVQVYQGDGRYQAAEEPLTALEADGELLAAEPDLRLEVAVSRLGQSRGLQSPPEVLLRHQGRLLSLYRQAGSARDGERRELLVEHAELLRKTGDQVASLDAYRELLELTRTQEGAQSEATVAVLTKLAETQIRLSEPAQAEAHLREALDIREQSGSLGGDETVHLLSLLAQVLESLKRPEEAVAVVERAAREPGPNQARFRLLLVDGKLRLGEPREALGLLSELDPEPLDPEARSRYELAKLRGHRALEEVEAGVVQARRMIGLSGLTSEALLEAHLWLGEEIAEDLPDQATFHLEEVLSHLGVEQHEQAKLLTRIADLARELEQREAATECYELAAAAYRDRLQPDEPDSVGILVEIGALHERRRSVGEAVSVWERALEGLKRFSSRIGSSAEERRLRDRLVISLGEAYIKQRRWERAEQAWGSLLRSARTDSREELTARLGLAEVGLEQLKFEKADEALGRDFDLVQIEERQGRELADRAFCFATVLRAERGEAEEAWAAINERRELRGSWQACSVKELWTALRVGTAWGRAQELSEPAEELARRRPKSSRDQLLLAHYYGLMAGEFRSVLKGSMSPKEAVDAAIYWAIEANGHLDLTVAELFEQKAKLSVESSAWEAAEEATRRSLELRRVLQGERSVTLLNPLLRLGELLLGRGELAEGVTQLNRALALADANLPPQHPSTRELLRSLLEAYRRSGDIEQARAALGRLMALYQRFPELPMEERLGDLMRGIRLLLGQPEQAKEQLLSYLDEATDLAVKRGEHALPSLAFCLGQRARLVAEEDVPAAVDLLKRQRVCLEGREERSEFEEDRYLLAQLQAFLGYPGAALKTLQEEGSVESGHSRRDWLPELLAIRCTIMLGRLVEAQGRLKAVTGLLEVEGRPRFEHFETASVWLDLQSLSPELEQEELTTQAYALLDRLPTLVDDLQLRTLPDVRGRWAWDLSRLRFEIRRLSEEAALERLSDQVALVRQEAPLPSLAFVDALCLLAAHEDRIGLFDACLTHLRYATKALAEHGDPQGLQGTTVRVMLGRVAEQRGLTEVAYRSYREAVEPLKEHFDEHHPHLLSVYLGLSRLAKADEDLDQTRESLLCALAILERQEEDCDRKVLCKVLRELAGLELKRERLQQALLYWQRTQQTFESRGETLPATWLAELTEVAWRCGEDEGAFELFLEALEKQVGPAGKALLELYSAWLERCAAASTEDRENAIRVGRLLKMRDRLLEAEPPGETSPAWARILLTCGRLVVRGHHGDPKYGVPAVERALETFEQHHGLESMPVAEALEVRAELALLEEQSEVAERCLTRALNIVETQRGSESWDAASIMIGLAQVYFHKQRFSSMEAVIQRAYELCETLLPVEDERWVQVLYLRGRFLLEMGRHKEASETLLRALALLRAKERNPELELLIDAGLACLHSEQAEPAERLLRLALERIPDDREEWNDRHEEVFLALGRLGVRSGDYTFAEDCLARALTVQEKRWGVNEPGLSRLYRLLTLAALGGGRLELAEERFELALALQEENLFQPVELFEPFLGLVEALVEAGDLDGALAQIERQQPKVPLDRFPQQAARLLAVRAKLEYQSGRYREAEKAWQQELEAHRRAGAGTAEARPEQRRAFLHALERAASLLVTEQRYTQAEELAQERLRVVEVGSEDDMTVTDVLFDLAEIYRLQELYREAQELHQRVLAIRAGSLGKLHPKVSLSLRALGQVHLGEGHFDQASTYLERALAQQSSELGAEHPDLADTLFALGDTSLALGDATKAEERFRKATELLRAQFGDQDIRTARAWAKLAAFFEEQQSWGQARPLLGRAVESVEAVLGPSHLEVADLLEKSATVYLESGAWEEVSEPLGRSLAIRLEQLGEDHPATARLYRLEGDYRAALGDLASARVHYEKADRVIGTYYGEASAQREPYRLALGEALRELEEWEPAAVHFKALLEREAAADDPKFELFRSRVLLGYGALERLRGNLLESEQHLKAALSLRSTRFSQASPEMAEVLEELARVHRLDGRSVTAAALAERALEAYGSETHERVDLRIGQARLQLLLARLEFDQENTEAAVRLGKSALGLRRELYGESHPDLAEALHLLGEIATAEQRLERAETFFEQALERWENFYGSAHPKVYSVVASLAKLYQQQGRLTLSQQYHQRNLEALEGRYGKEHPLLAETLIGLGRLCRSQGNSAQAEQYLKRAAEIQTAVFGGGDPKVASVLHALALVYQDQRNFLAAEALLKKALQIRQSLSEEETSELAESHLALARLYRSSGKAREAEPLLKKVLEWKGKRYGERHPEVAGVLREMAELYGDQQENLKAQVLVGKALEIYEESLGRESLELVGPLRQLARFQEAAGDREEAATLRQRVEELIAKGG